MIVANMPSKFGFKNFTPRRIIIHAMAEFIDTDGEDYFAPNFLDTIGLSAHAFITSSGVIIRSRADDEGAYHAKGANADSLGVEILVPGLHTYESFTRTIKGDWCSKLQFETVGDLVLKWRIDHDIDTV